ncbi:MAG: hypothetical protein DRR42_19305 [Gammaproteobacteria bacterium]|nr:MAG: hypothetical protein DRR42_19305 [Gammaproteobacteria bacterium]
MKIEILIPILLVLIMLIVGTGLRAAQFGAILRSPVPLVGGTLIQILLLPAGAVAIIYLFEPPIELAAGLLLISTCPGGALSNFYCHFGKLNVALSVLMTAVSSSIGFLILPVVLALIFPLALSAKDINIPILGLIFQLFLLTLLPSGVFAVEYAVRNAAAAAVVAATALGRPEFVIFSALFVVIQFPMIMLMLWWSRQQALARS